MKEERKNFDKQTAEAARLFRVRLFVRQGQLVRAFVMRYCYFSDD